MSDQTAGVAPGTLSGVNLSGDDDAPEAALPNEDDRTLGEAAADAPVTPADEPPVPAPEPEPEPEPEPPAPEPEPAVAESPKSTKKGAPARQYVVLKQGAFEDGDEFFTKVHEVEARNAQNAMRQAFKDLSQGEAEATEATLVVIPKSMFRPTAVRLARTERVSVQFG